MVIGDVGQGAREEVDYAPAAGPSAARRQLRLELPRGADRRARRRPAQCAAAARFIDPVFDYPHADPGGGVAHGCAIIGGYVARDPASATSTAATSTRDLCVGEIRSLLPPPARRAPATAPRASTSSNLNSFGEDSCGRLYVVSGGGTVYRFDRGGAGDLLGNPKRRTAGPKNRREGKGRPAQKSRRGFCQPIGRELPRPPSPGRPRRGSSAGVAAGAWC